MTADPSRLHALADLLDDEDTYAVVVGAIADARDKAPRHPEDRDSAVVIDEVIAALRTAS